jgi:prevent-host-death family protein
METAGSFEAKTHLSRLLDRVARGEEFTITKHGKPEAKPVTYTATRPKPAVRKAVEDMKPSKRKHSNRGRSALPRWRAIQQGAKGGSSFPHGHPFRWRLS